MDVSGICVPVDWTGFYEREVRTEVMEEETDEQHDVDK